MSLAALIADKHTAGDHRGPQPINLPSFLEQGQDLGSLAVIAIGYDR
jgi:hypothetical protein